MKRILSFFAAAVLAAVSVSAQTVTLDEVCTSLTEHKVTTGKFVQERKSQKLKKPVSSSGVYIICTEGVVWKTEKPFPSVSAVTESKIIQTLPSGKKNVIDGSSNEVFKTVSKTLSSLFSGNKKQLEENFILKDFSAENEQWILMLEPKDRTIASVLRS
ncbi:MAG: outer-membrane lipoprotein carrier protein LolA, partial [Treponema sp.]|nr:outer-membrane lipoprotein carrier protein LolA [Treponema sp.]